MGIINLENKVENLKRLNKTEKLKVSIEKKKFESEMRIMKNQLLLEKQLRASVTRNIRTEGETSTRLVREKLIKKRKELKCARALRNKEENLGKRNETKMKDCEKTLREEREALKKCKTIRRRKLPRQSIGRTKKSNDVSFRMLQVR